MTDQLSQRLRAIFGSLPLAPGMRVLEVGCGPGSLARAISSGIGEGHVLGIDRSSRAIVQAIEGSAAKIAAGRMSFRQIAAENFAPHPDEKAFDLIVAVRVGALDGRHPALGARAWPRLIAALSPAGRINFDGGEKPTG